jgi:signal transduction histidine kinase
LIKAKERAEESDRLKSAFLANMSHEIRTPMNGILGFAELLGEPDLADEKQQYYIKIIEKSGKRMLNIINDIIGISKDKQESIFERFIQADCTNRKAFDGTGLGLSISKSYVEMLGGSMWLESAEDVGSTFYFTIPYTIDR